MPEKRGRQKVVRGFPSEETWLRSFAGFHGTDGRIRFCEDDLGGVSLVRIVEVLLCGQVVSAEKCDNPGTICIVEYRPDADEALISVTVHFVGNEEMLTVLSAEAARELGNGSDHAA